MPRISAFHGIVIYMYWSEAAHEVVHFHAFYGEQGASVALDGSILAGHLQPRAHSLVMEWAALHGGELQANWERARRMEPLVAIAPLP